MSIGQRIKTMRTQQGLTIEDLAYRLGKNRTTIYRYENGDIENLPLSILDSLAEALNTTPAYLMGWNTSENEGGLEYEIKEPTEITYLTAWFKEYGVNTLTNEERDKVLEYAKFLVSIRSN